MEKKLRTAAADVHNNNSYDAGEDPVVLAAAVSRAQLLALVADLALRLASLTYHLHNIHRSQVKG